MRRIHGSHLGRIIFFVHASRSFWEQDLAAEPETHVLVAAGILVAFWGLETGSEFDTPAFAILFSLYVLAARGSHFPLSSNLYLYQHVSLSSCA